MKIFNKKTRYFFINYAYSLSGITSGISSQTVVDYKYPSLKELESAAKDFLLKKYGKDADICITNIIELNKQDYLDLRK